MKKTTILLSAALMFFGLTAKAQTTITFDTEDYKSVGVYDKWEESPFRTGELEGNAGVALNPSTTPDEVLGVAPNSSEKVVAFQRSRYGSNVYGVRIDLKEPIRVTKQLQYIHVMTYLKDKPAVSRMMVIGLGKRLEESWSGQSKDDVEQFWSLTPANVEPKDGWQDIVVSFKGFSYSKEENANSGIDLHSLVIVPDVRTPDEDVADWVAYFDEIVVDNNPNKRFSTEQYALTYDKEAAMTRDDRAINSVGLSVGGKSYSSPGPNKKFYANNTTKSVFSAMAGAEVQPTFSYKGGWMNAYVYVDWGRDALFKDALNANGTPAEGSDVVSYNAVQIGGDTWYKSDGTTVGNGNNIGAGVPKFTVPAGTPAGFYRMRYKVDWNSIDPAGGSTIISDGGGIVDVMLDVHGDKVAVNASQLNGDIYAADGTDLINYEVGYEQPLKVKIVPAPGFVQYGFTLKYGYDVAAKEQLDDKGNPNYIEVKVPYTEVAGDGTYTIPAEYMRGSQVSIEGDMQQVQPYTVEVVGLEGQGGVVYANIETTHGGTVNATQFFTVDQVEPIAVDGYDGEVTLNGRVITVTYTLGAEPCREISSLSELKNYKLYHIKAKSGEGYLAWNSSITNDYLSLRGVINTSHNGESSDVAVANKYKEEVNPFDETVVWQIILEDDKYYLYHPARNAYVTRDGRDYKFTETKTALDAIRDNGDGTFGFHAGGGYSDGSTNFACIVTNSDIGVRNWTWDDHGAVMQIIENPNVYTLEYTVEVVGGVAGGITLEGADYLNGDKVMATRFLTAADVTAKELFLSEAVVTVDKEAAKISVVYSGPVLNPTSYYTLKCKATDHIGFIGDDGSVINGRASNGSYFVFEPGGTAGTYYIKSVVSGKYINHDGANISASTAKSTAWILDVPAHTAGVATFSIGNDKYLNNNGSDCADGTCTSLKANHHAGGPGTGNACSLWELTEYKDVEAVLAQWKESILAHLGYVGGYPADLTDEIQSVVTIADKEAFEATYEVLAIDESTYYRLVCVSPKSGNGDITYNTLTFNGVANLVTQPASTSDANQIFQFEVADEGTYYLKNLNAGKYLNKIGAGDFRSAVVDKADACKVELLNYDSSQWRLYNSESGNAKHCLFAENHAGESVPYACSGWENGINSASAWRIVPVAELEITINEYASVYLPFDVEVEGAIVYAVTGTSSSYVTLDERSGIPAGKGAILAGNGIAKLALAEVASDWSNNLLKGTTMPQSINEAAYILADSTHGIGLYKVELADGSFTNNANKAYLPASVVSDASAVMFSFKRGEDSTNIDKAELTIQNAGIIYDLMGRRVVKMEKGIYIVNGEKVIR